MDELHLAEELTNDMVPIIKILVAGIIAIGIKDFISKVSKGLAFYLNGAFNEGDRVKIDDSDAIIVKIGLSQTVFSIIKEDGDYVWRYVPNDMISILKLEKVIYDAESQNNRESILRNKEHICDNKDALDDHIETDTKECKHKHS
jgi:hypothetical protein